MTATKPLAWISADMSSAITARQVENIPEFGGDPSQLYPIPLYPKEAVMTDNASIRPDMVRELEWKWTSNRAHSAATIFGFYKVIEANPAIDFLTPAWRSPEGGFVQVETDEQARAAAQADYASRIASALSPAFLERIAALEAENARLREVVSQCANALGTGAFISPEASVDFMEMLPKEIRLMIARTTLQEHAEDGKRQGDEG